MTQTRNLVHYIYHVAYKYFFQKYETASHLYFEQDLNVCIYIVVFLLWLFEVLSMHHHSKALNGKRTREQILFLHYQFVL